MSEQCRNCGAEIEYQAGSQSLVCPYCNTLNEIKKPEDELPTEVDLIIPLSINQKDLENQVYIFLAKDNYAPDDIIQSAIFLKRECLYVPAYIFRIDYQAEWTASFGYDRKEPYTDYKTINGRSQAYTAYRTVTDWRPVNGTDANTFEVSIYAGTNLTSLALTPAEMIPAIIANGERTAFNPDFMQGVTSESFAIPEKLAFDSLSEEINENIDYNVKQHAQGDRQKDWHWTLSHIESSTGTLLVPICNAVFDYKGTNYSYWCDGIGNANIVADKLPVDSNRKRNVQLGFIPICGAILGLLLVSLQGNKLYGAGIFALILTIGYALLRRHFILDYSKKIRESFLNQKIASSASVVNMTDEEREAYAQSFVMPKRPFLAETARDKVVLPILAVAAFLIALIPAIIAGGSALFKGSYSGHSSSNGFASAFFKSTLREAIFRRSSSISSIPDPSRAQTRQQQQEEQLLQREQQKVEIQEQQIENTNWCEDEDVRDQLFKQEANFIKTQLKSRGLAAHGWRFNIYQSKETSDSMGGPEFKCKGTARVLSGDASSVLLFYEISYSMFIDEGHVGVSTDARGEVEPPYYSVEHQSVEQEEQQQRVEAINQQRQEQLQEQQRQRKKQEQLQEQQRKQKLPEKQRKQVKLKNIFESLKSIKREGPVEVNPTD